jgi:phospholipid/cholesterol/gamma-HCH transport system ATP-binding protein
MSDENLVKVTNLSFYRGEKKIFSNLNLNVQKGKITAIMGPSGTGKTTLLKLIGGELEPQAGTVFIDEKNVHKLRRKALHQLRKKVGILFQSGALFTNLSVFENVAFPIREHTKLSDSLIRDIVLMKLEAVGLRGARDLMPEALSGGMARRVAMARALAFDPMLMMYDEPFTGQDPISMGVLVKLIKTLNQTLKTTSIVVSHDVEETLSIADYVYLINQGQVIAEGTPLALKNSKDAAVSQFIHGRGDGVVPFHYPAPRLEEDLMHG